MGNGTKKRNEELELEFDSLTDNMLTTIEKLKWQLQESQQKCHQQAKTIETIAKEKGDYVQRLNEEIDIRSQAEAIFDVERKELTKMLEDEVSKRCDIERDRKNLCVRLNDEIKKRRQLEDTNQQLRMKEKQRRLLMKKEQQAAAQ